MILASKTAQRIKIDRSQWRVAFFASRCGGRQYDPYKAKSCMASLGIKRLRHVHLAFS